MHFLILFLAAGGLFLFFSSDNRVLLKELAQLETVVSQPEPEKPDPNADLPPQLPLSNPPEALKVIYATGWSAGSQKKMDYLIGLIKDTELNAIIIDIKDYSGTLSYHVDLELPKKYGAGASIKILKPNALIKRLHDEGIYVIARQAVFQDPVLAKARPDLALASVSTGKLWKDNHGLQWIDPLSKDAWDYNIAITKDALARGFDEVNLDYIRFASDGNLSDVKYPFWDGKVLKRKVISEFFKYVRQALPDANLSADLFGLVTIHENDIGVGQNLEDAYHYFNAVAPMVYPSHYNVGFNGHKNPALYPYDVVYTSMLEAEKRLRVYEVAAAVSTSTERYLVKHPQLRPWLQDFDLGATYDAEKVRAQISAVYDAASSTQASWMLWAPSNNYTREALQLSD